MTEYPKSSLNKVGGRTSNRGVYDEETVHGIINEALLVQVAFIDEDGLPQIVPMNGQVEQDDEGYYVLLHGQWCKSVGALRA